MPSWHSHQLTSLKVKVSIARQSSLNDRCRVPAPRVSTNSFLSFAMISERSSAGDKGVRFGSFAGNDTASRSSGTLLAVVAFGAVERVLAAGRIPESVQPALAIGRSVEGEQHMLKPGSVDHRMLMVERPAEDDRMRTIRWAGLPRRRCQAKRRRSGRSYTYGTQPLRSYTSYLDKRN